MGWTYTHKPHGVKARDFLRLRFEQTYLPGEKTGFRILHDSATLTEYYAIIERTDKDTSLAELFCLVCLVRHSRDHHNFGWKEMEESCFPYVTPPRGFFRVLEEMIPDPDNKNAREWREACRTHYAKLDAQPRFKVGDEITLYDHQYRLIEDLKQRGFRAQRIPFGGQYRIKRTQLRTATLTAPTIIAEALPCS